jgi:hypothetical protein
MLGGLQVEERSGAVDGIIIRCGGGSNLRLEGF